MDNFIGYIHYVDVEDSKRIIMPKGLKGFQKGNTCGSLVKWTLERKNICRKKRLGQKHTPETKEKISIKSKLQKRKRGKEHCNFKGKVIDGGGYFKIYSPDHPFKTNHNYVLEHRLILEKYLKRYLLPQEKTHHINKDRQNNQLSNLMLFKNQAAHMRFELLGISLKEDIIFDGRKL